MDKETLGTILIVGLVVLGLSIFITYYVFDIPSHANETNTYFIIGVHRGEVETGLWKSSDSDTVTISYGLGSRTLDPYYPFKLGHIYNVTSTRNGHIWSVVEVPIEP